MATWRFTTATLIHVGKPESPLYTASDNGRYDL